MKYKIEQRARGLTIEIRGDELKKAGVQEALQQCREGRCDCPTDEYDKLDTLQIEQGVDRLFLHLKVKPGQSIAEDAVAACLDHTLMKSKQDD